jgi:cytochrome c oxidase subunit 2
MMLVGMLGLIAGVGSHAVPARANAPAPRVVEIQAGKYRFTPDHITLKRGVPVTLRFTSADATHGFMIRALNIDTDIKPGAATEVTVRPATAGNFKAICDHYCGIGHGGMKMSVAVE